MKNADKLAIPEEYIEFRRTLFALRDLNEMCSKEILPDNHTAVINHFTNCWYTLADKFNLSTSPKLHIIIDHLDDYYCETKLSLVKTLDQLIENMHQYMHKVMNCSMYKVKHTNNPRQGLYLYRAVNHINSKNVHVKNIDYLKK